MKTVRRADTSPKQESPSGEISLRLSHGAFCSPKPKCMDSLGERINTFSYITAILKYIVRQPLFFVLRLLNKFPF